MKGSWGEEEEELKRRKLRDTDSAIDHLKQKLPRGGIWHPRRLHRG